MNNPEPNNVTIRDVARLAGVSVATISRYLNQKAVIAEDTRRRVETAMAELKYIPRASARNLATRQTRTLGLLLTEIQGDFFTTLLKGVESVVSAADYSLLIATTVNAQGSLNPAVGPHNTDGILVFLESMEAATMTEFHQRNFPMILIHQTPPRGLDIPCVTIENKNAARRIVSHLIEIHQRHSIAYLSGPQGNEDAYWRAMGYQEALIGHNIPYNPGLTRPGNFDRTTARSSTLELLDEHPQIDAIFAGDDEAAIGALAALHGLGRRVPEDVALVGFDDQNLAQFLNPPLTTVNSPSQDVGQTAARNLLHLLWGEPVDLLTLLPTELVIRKSCGCL